MIPASPTLERPVLRVVPAEVTPAIVEPRLGGLGIVLVNVLPRLAFIALALLTGRVAGAFAYDFTSSLGFFLFPVTTVARTVATGNGTVVLAVAAALADALVLGATLVWLSARPSEAEWV
jgi:hypothetical protein